VVNLAATADAPPRAGERATVRIVEATPHSLIGEPVGPGRRPMPVKPAGGSADEGGRSAVP